MTRISTSCKVAALALSFSSLPISSAFAHCFVGARFFQQRSRPMTPASRTRCRCLPCPGRGPETCRRRRNWIFPARYRSASPKISAFRSATAGRRSANRSPTVAGFDNLETAFQYQLLKDPTHETAILLGLVVNSMKVVSCHKGGFILVFGFPHMSRVPTRERDEKSWQRGGGRLSCRLEKLIRRS